MLILDRSRALDRLIWTAGRYTLVVPDPFSTTSTITTVTPPTLAGDPRWRDDPLALDRGPHRLSSTLELRALVKRAS